MVIHPQICPMKDISNAMKYTFQAPWQMFLHWLTFHSLLWLHMAIWKLDNWLCANYHIFAGIRMELGDWLCYQHLCHKTGISLVKDHGQHITLRRHLTLSLCTILACLLYVAIAPSDKCRCLHVFCVNLDHGIKFKSGEFYPFIPAASSVINKIATKTTHINFFLLVAAMLHAKTEAVSACFYSAEYDGNLKSLDHSQSSF